MDVQLIKHKLAEMPNEFFRKNGIVSVRLFGSYLHGNAETESDLDLLIDLDPSARIGYLKLSGIRQELSEKLNVNVDLHTPGSLSERFRSIVEAEAAFLYER